MVLGSEDARGLLLQGLHARPTLLEKHKLSDKMGKNFKTVTLEP